MMIGGVCEWKSVIMHETHPQSMDCLANQRLVQASLYCFCSSANTC